MKWQSAKRRTNVNVNNPALFTLVFLLPWFWHSPMFTSLLSCSLMKLFTNCSCAYTAHQPQGAGWIGPRTGFLCLGPRPSLGSWVLQVVCSTYSSVILNMLSTWASLVSVVTMVRDRRFQILGDVAIVSIRGFCLPVSSSFFLRFIFQRSCHQEQDHCFDFKCALLRLHEKEPVLWAGEGLRPTTMALTFLLIYMGSKPRTCAAHVPLTSSALSLGPL